MNALYVARKIFRQFIRDRRTMALIFLVPVVIMTIYYFLLKDDLGMKLTLAVISTERGSAPYKAFAEVLGGQKNIDVIEDPGPTAAEAIGRTGADAAIELPDGFFAALAKNEEPRFALRIEGTFAEVHTRSVPRQENYRPLVEVAAHQPEFSFMDAEGTLAGFYTPSFITRYIIEQALGGLPRQRALLSHVLFRTPEDEQAGDRQILER